MITPEVVAVAVWITHLLQVMAVEPVLAVERLDLLILAAEVAAEIVLAVQGGLEL